VLAIEDVASGEDKTILSATWSALI